MNDKKYPYIGIFMLLIVIGWFLPIDNYTTTKGCPTEPTPTKRLHLILGDSIQEIENGDIDPPPNVGCSENTKYVLYIL